MTDEAEVNYVSHFNEHGNANTSRNTNSKAVNDIQL